MPPPIPLHHSRLTSLEISGLEMLEHTGIGLFFVPRFVRVDIHSFILEIVF